VTTWTDCEDTYTLGGLTIGGVSMFTPAWRCENLWELWQPPEQRGDDRIRPGVSGSFAVKRRIAATRRTLLMHISGLVDPFGVIATTNPMAQMAFNLRSLEIFVVNATNVGDGTRSLVLTMPTGLQRTAPVHVLGMEISEMRHDAKWCNAAIELSIPGGRLVDVPPPSP